MSSATTPLALELSSDEALVLFDLLSRFSDTGKLHLADQAEHQVLWNICGELEKRLAEPFRNNYTELLEAARGRLRPSSS